LLAIALRENEMLKADRDARYSLEEVILWDTKCGALVGPEHKESGIAAFVAATRKNNVNGEVEK
jgi:hypothetical protein